MARKTAKINTAKTIRVPTNIYVRRMWPVYHRREENQALWPDIHLLPLHQEEHGVQPKVR